MTKNPRMGSLRELLLVASGGAIGATVRYLTSKAALMWLPLSFPWGTFLINVTGCLAMGMVAGFADQSSISPGARLFLATGLLGGYTTFSAFGLEAQSLLAGDRLGAAFCYVAGQAVLGVAAVFLGLAIVRRLG